MTIERKIDKFSCYKCDGKGKIGCKKCDVCNGIGKWEESTYYFIDENTNQCWSGDTLK